jgi:hypothetical protein
MPLKAKVVILVILATAVIAVVNVSILLTPWVWLFHMWFTIVTGAAEAFIRTFHIADQALQIGVWVIVFVGSIVGVYQAVRLLIRALIHC